jgi:4-hydroxy-3-methylbut-2-enyl diphosphate reductase
MAIEKISDMKYDLAVTIDKASGFCFGVVYAIEMAEDILAEEDYLYCLGDIVHNDEEVRRLTDKGLRIIDHEQLSQLQNEKVLIRAHGEAPSTYELALQNNLILIDASCPVVLKLQNRIKNSYDDSEQILIFGKHGHAEVIGLQGQTEGNAIVFQDLAELDQVDLPARFTLSRGYEVKANDTICRQVSNRYEDLEKFVVNYDRIIFVSGKKSSNGKVLYDVCKKYNDNSYFISSIDELDLNWFSPKDKIGICGATSTPMWLMEQVKATLESF